MPFLAIPTSEGVRESTRLWNGPKLGTVGKAHDWVNHMWHDTCVAAHMVARESGWSTWYTAGRLVEYGKV